MGKILVLYQSNSGNTAKMAELVAEGVRNDGRHELRLRSVEEATVADLQWTDGIALGSPTNFGTVSWRMKKWWDDLPTEVWSTIDGKIGCSFSSAGGLGGGTELACMTLLTMLMNYGFLVFGVTDYVDERATLHYGAAIAGPPDSENDQEVCRRLGARLCDWVERYFD